MLRSLVNVRRYQVANTIGFIAVVLVNAMANILPINDLNTGQISDMYPNLFVPVPLTFGIWLVIYLGLGMFILYQWGVFSGWNDDYASVTAAIGWMFSLSCVFNCLWIVVWHYLFVELSLVIMLALFLALLVIVNRLHQRRDPSAAEKNWVHGPFSIYFGWISVATIANVTAVLVANEWGALGIAESVWTIGMIFIATAITAAVVLRRRNFLFPGGSLDSSGYLPPSYRRACPGLPAGGRYGGWGGPVLVGAYGAGAHRDRREPTAGRYSLLPLISSTDR